MLEVRFDFLFFRASDDLRLVNYFDERGGMDFLLSFFDNLQGSSNSVAQSCFISNSVSILTMQTMIYTILDGGNAPLIIGDYTSIGSGSHIYTHNTIERVLTGGKAPTYKKETKIGKCCFISPLAMIGPGTEIGDHCFIASHVVISGSVTVGERCFFGVNSTIRDNIKIAKNCVIGAGAIITKDTVENGIYYGPRANVLKQTGDSKNLNKI